MIEISPIEVTSRDMIMAPDTDSKPIAKFAGHIAQILCDNRVNEHYGQLQGQGWLFEAERYET